MKSLLKFFWIFVCFALLPLSAQAGCDDYGDGIWCMAPEITYLQPVKGASVVADTPFKLTVGATDYGTSQLIIYVRLYRSGAFIGEKYFYPNTNSATAVFDIPGLSAGAHQFEAKVFDQGGRVGTSGVFTINAQQSLVASSTSVSVSPANPIAGQMVTVTAQVSGNSPTGTVTFGQWQTWGTFPIVNGQATTTVMASSGAVTYYATYNGDTRNHPSSGQTTIVGSKAPTTTAISASPQVVVAGQSVTLSATVSGGYAPMGTVTFKDGNQVLDTLPIYSGRATLAVTPSGVGDHAYSAIYNGNNTGVNNDDHAPSASPSTVVTVSRLPSQTTFAISPSRISAGQIVSFNATVTGNNPTGTVQFKAGDVVLGRTSVFSNIASHATHLSNIGQHSVIAYYDGDGNNAPSSSSPVTLTIEGLISRITVEASPVSTTAGLPVTITAKVSALNLAGETVFPNGIVTFRNGNSILSSQNLSAGSATYVGSFVAGTHSITATYEGEGTASAAVSSPVRITVEPPPIIKTSTQTALTASPLSAEYGSTATLTARVIGDSPGGTVTFKNALVILGTATLSNGIAALQTNPLETGSYYITATYNGDEKNLVSVSNEVGVVIAPPKVVAAVNVIAEPFSATVGQLVTFTATVSGKNPSGTITFKSGATQIGTAAVSNGTARFSIDSLAAGVYSVTASYSGDSGNTAASSEVTVFTVSLTPSRTTASASPGIATLGQSITLTATVVGGTPTGTVTFRRGTTDLGTSAINAGAAALVVSSLPAGEHQITATYSGDVKVAPSTSAQVAVSVSAALPAVVTPHMRNPDAGTLPGAGSVQGGKAKYSIPIALPPGIANMVPTVSLEYGGSTGNSVLGVGWSLNASSAIVRCGPVIGVEEKVDAIRLTNKDRLCLNGQQLVLSKPFTDPVGTPSYDESYWSSQAVYSTKSEQFLRVERSGTGFVVRAKNGRVSFYGGTRNSERGAMLGSTSVVHTWAIRSVNDRSSNTIDYEYVTSTETGEHLISSIRWGGNLIAQRSFAKVSFEYKSRPDPEIRFINGGRADMNQRLERIITTTDTAEDGSGGLQATEYIISYGASPTSGRSVIKNIQGCSTDGGCMPATKFAWGEPDPAATRQYLSKGTWNGPILEDRVVGPGGNLLGHSQDELYIANDFNHDGKSDLLTRYGGSGIKLYTSTDTGFTVNSPFGNLATDDAVVDVGDFNGDGFTDVLVSKPSVDSAGVLQILQGNLNNPRVCLGSTSGTFMCQSIAVDTANSTFKRVYDFDGDGRDDLYLENQFVVGSARVCLSASRPTSAAFTCQSVPVGNEMEQPNPDPTFQRRFAALPTTDLDGDGRLDLISAGAPVYVEDYKIWNFFEPSIWYSSYKATSEEKMARTRSILFDFDVPAEYMSNTPAQYRTSVNGAAGDLNGDGYSDLFFAMGPTPVAQMEWRRCYSRGTLSKMACENVTGLPKGTLKYIGDIDGDGSSKVLVYGSVAGTSTMNYHGCDLRMVSAPSCVSWSTPSFPSARENAIDTYQGERLFSMNVTGDSRQEMIHYQPGGKWEIFAATSIAKQGEALDRLVEVTNGLGLVTRFDYADAAEISTIYSSKPAAANGSPVAFTYPVALALPPDSLVKSIRISNGQSGWNEIKYKYGGAARDYYGNGYLGFARIDATNVGSGITTTTWYSQDSYYIGMATAMRESTANGIVLTDSASQLAALAVLHDSLAITSFPYVKKQTIIKRDLDNTPVNTTVVDWTYKDAYGNAGVVKETITGGGKTYVTETTRQFKNIETNWLIGLPISEVVVKTADGTSVKRSTSSDYDNNGLLSVQTQEPNDASLRVRTSFARNNPYGIVSQTSQEWLNPATSASESRIVSEILEFDGKFRFATKVKNAESHVTQLDFDPRNGVKTKEITPNSATTSWKVNGFGRVLAELRPDSTESRMSTKQCDAECPSNAMYVSITEQVSNGKHYKAPSLTYMDDSGRKVQDKNWGFDGTPVIQDYRYDSLGRLTDTYHPRFLNANPVLASTQHYDNLDRITSRIVYDENDTARETTTTYNGLKTTVKTARAKQVQEFIRVRNGVGLLAEAIDPDKNSTQYLHDPNGNLLKVVDPKGNVVNVTYDLLGRRKSLKDPDLGEITYDVDPLGRTWRQQSPKDRLANRFTRMTYDRLDRLVKREETDLLSTWVFDTALNGIGQLSEAYTGSAADYTYKRQHTYDKLGRPATTTDLLDTKYVSEITYDEFGRQALSIHQRGTGDRKVYSYVYNELGYLRGINGPRGSIWEAKAIDAAGRVVESKSGNGLVSKSDFNPHSGRLQSSSTGIPGLASELIEEYRYNELGHVKQRNQWWTSGGYTEEFEYDNLDRIEKAQVLGRPTSEASSFTYDSIGNVKSKSGVGSGPYVYPDSGLGAVRPHAVSSIPGLGSYQYDVNGNLEAGPNGTSFTWTNFDMPTRLEKNGKSSEFVYGTEHQRIKQTRSDGTRQYYSGAIEAEVTGDSEIVRTYWPNGLGFEIENLLRQTKDDYWVHKDNLGSVVGVSGVNGGLLERMAYDVWGKRRGLDGAPSLSVLVGVVNHRGFTGHEMLDNLELVHMNARVYDPVIARFISADAVIQDPEHSQSYNRYSYVWNNPANLTDPTGLEAVEQDSEKNIRQAAKRYCNSSAEGLMCSSRVTQFLLNSGANGAEADNAGVARPTNGLESKGNSENSGGFWSKASNFLGQANRSFGVLDSFMPSRTSFESGAQRFMGGPCEYNCFEHDVLVRSTADVMEGATQGVIEGGNRYYPELFKTAFLSALPLGKFAEEYTMLFRSVSRRELGNVANLGKLTPGGGSMDNKWFAETAADAAAWGKQFFGFDKEVIYTLRIRIPNDLASKMMRNERLDNIGPARSADAKLLDEINRRSRIDALNGNVLK